MDKELRQFWNRYFGFNWKFGLFLVLVVCIPRFMLVLNANKTGKYHLIGVVMFISALVPFVFLNRAGREKIGLKTPNHPLVSLLSLIAGVSFSVILYWIGQELYGNSFENWYAYIGKSYQIPAAISEVDRRTMFLMMAAMGMIFSPIGEELFFRGIVHGSFAKSIGDKRASIIDSSAFALTHLSHFGLVFIDDKWTFYVLPGLLWVLSMILVSLLFFEMKKRTDSVWGAVICHSAFNLGMIYCIFYLM